MSVGESVVERGGEATFQRGRTRRRGGRRRRARRRRRISWSWSWSWSWVFADGGGWRERRAETRPDGFGVIVYRGGRDGTREPRGSRRGRGRGRGRGRRRRRTRWAQLCVSVMNAGAALEVRGASRRRLAIREDARLLLGGETGLSGGRRRRVRPEGRRRARRRVVRRDCRADERLAPPSPPGRNLDIVPPASDGPSRPSAGVVQRAARGPRRGSPPSRDGPPRAPSVTSTVGSRTDPRELAT